MFNQKGIAHMVLILILLLGIVAGVFLVGKTQIFKPKATSSSIEFLDNECTKVEGTKKVLTCPTVRFDLVSPLEITGSTDASFQLVKTAYAAGSGQNYFCKAGDTSHIYKNVCDLPCVSTSSFFCLCNVPWWKDHLQPRGEACDLGQECQPLSEGVFAKGAQCGPAKTEPTGSFPAPAGNFKPAPSSLPDQAPIQSGSFSRLNGINSPTPTARSLAAAPTLLTPTLTTPRGAATPTPTASPTSQGGGTSAPTPNPAANTDTGVTAPNAGTGTTAPNAGAGSTAPNAGTGVTNPPAGGATNPSPSAPARVTKKYRFADDPNFLDDKQQPVKWKTYKAGGVSETFTFNDTPGEKFIYAQFMDDQGQIIKFPSGDGFIAAHIELKAPAASAEPSAKASSSPAASSKAPAAPAAPAAPVQEAACDLQGDIANWRNCTKAGLKATLLTLPQSTRNLLPNDALMIFNEAELMSLFPPSQTSRLSLLPSSALTSFSNSDLLAIADSFGNRLAFLSTFSCERIVKFSLDIQQSVGCASADNPQPSSSVNDNWEKSE